MEFSNLLEKKGIPENLYKPVRQSKDQEIQFASSVISKICQAYPIHEQKLQPLGDFFISIIVLSK
jgi:hypothetical protein